jgi:PAS domain-containing protein
MALTMDDQAWREGLIADHVLGMPSSLLDLLPIGICVCDGEGKIVRYNKAAARLWGRAPRLDKVADRFCGSHRLYRLDGKAVAHERCSMADVLSGGPPVRNGKIVYEVHRLGEHQSNHSRGRPRRRRRQLLP